MWVGEERFWEMCFVNVADFESDFVFWKVGGGGCLTFISWFQIRYVCEGYSGGRTFAGDGKLRTKIFRAHVSTGII